jgi:hypothetical protein
MRPTIIGCLALACATLAFPTAAQDTTLRGAVRESANRPARDVQVGSFWSFDDGEPRVSTGARTDRRGHFSFTDEVYGPVGLLALDLEAQLGAVAVSDRDLQSFALELGPLTRVHGLIRSSGLGHTPEWTNVYVNLPFGDKKARIASHSSHEAEFSFLLPAGTYQFHVYGTDVESRNVEVIAEGPELDLGSVDLEATALARLYGKPAPALTVSETRGVDRGVQLEDYRGKYVVLEFWGHW